MKHNSIYHHTLRQPMYPGAADANYFAGKAFEILGAILSGAGALTMMLLLVTMA